MIADDYRAIAARRAEMARERARNLEGVVETWCSKHGAGTRPADSLTRCPACFAEMLAKNGGRVVKVER